MSKEDEEGNRKYDWALAESFKNIQCPVVEYLMYKLQDNNEWIRCFAAHALGEIDYVRSIDALVQH